MELHYEFSGFSFDAAPDPDKADRIRVTILKGGEPFTDLHGRPIERAFMGNIRPESVEEFCRRFATDSAYRNELLVKQTLSCC